MTMIGTVISGIALFITCVNLGLAYICLVLANPVKRIASRTVPRVVIPTDWDQIMTETAIFADEYKGEEVEGVEDDVPF